MSANNYIVSSEGFYVGKQLIYDGECNPPKVIGSEYIWTKCVREAKKFTGKSANNVIKGNGFNAFIWNPYKEEPIRNKYKVVQRKDHFDFYNDDKEHKVLEWKAVKVYMESKTDAKFLMFGNSKDEEYYDEETANEVARKKNLEMLIELETKMNKPNVIKNETFPDDERIII